MAKKQLSIGLLVFSLFTMLALSACGIDTTYSGTMNVVEASKVGEEYLSGQKVIVIDARGQEAYEKGHLKGSIQLSPAELVVETPVPNTLAAKDQVEKVLSDKGISNDSIIYVYDENDGVNAGRVWWTLKVYGHESVMIVNGGASALVNEGLEITKDEPATTKSEYVAKEADPSMMVTFEEVKAQAESPAENIKILDVRSVAEYEAGFIPGALLYPHTKNLYKDGTFMSSRDIGLFYKDLGLEKDETILLYCKTSFRATQTAALLQEAGYKNVKVYDGAWLEWESKMGVQTPVENMTPVNESDGS